MMRAVAAVVLAAATAAGCSAQAPAAPSAGHERFDYQLGAAYDPDGGLDVVVRDATASPSSGAYSICYVNGFQTQPGQAGEWGEDLLLHDADGGRATDPDWPDEYILDPSDADKRSRIDAVIGSTIDGCAAAGFAAVEIDNLDVWTRFPAISENAVLELARLYAQRAHAAGLDIAQKNAAEYAGRIKDEVGFDFAVSEECVAFDECSSYTDAYGSRVYDVEYTDNLGGSFEAMCASNNRPAITILRDRDLVDPGDPDYEYRQCE